MYGTITKLAVVVAVAIYFLFLNRGRVAGQHDSMSTNAIATFTAVSFLVGAFCSGLSGYIGMWASLLDYYHIWTPNPRFYSLL